ncbi:MAG: DinB family protein [Bacteroidia bacterium]|nr:DinB family protein [Bacteroidia bacterium]NND09648.1 DinB family protein [Flavobacteriaceae bacterium]MBT8308965.1 DinB family protein [Bacteroidia bacterium]NNK28860.1 DinB family protein [Flavobacteriaceae bacterium]NNL60430.1 DinB family protein [Flavobacteriaceae bacterium]
MIDITKQLKLNKLVFLELLKGVDSDFITWRPSKEKWCLLEIICHLYDEERDDFRFRVKWVLDNPEKPPPPFNPLDWIIERKYMNQDYGFMVQEFIKERDDSVLWLQSLENANWDNSYYHEEKGELSARYYLSNWLAHDYLHMRQIIKQKFDYLEYLSESDLNYAGKW